MYTADAIEEIAVRYQPAPALCVCVFPLVSDLDTAKVEIVVEIGSQELVMVAQDPHYLRIVAGFLEYLLYHARLVGGPAPLVHMDLPGIDDIAHQVDPVSVVVIQEIHEHPGLAMPAA